MQHIIFHQDGAPAHYSRKVGAFLHEQLSDRWTGRRGPIEWAPRLPDLIPRDFFLWGYIKLKVYGTRPRDVPTFEERIRNPCASVISEILSDVGQACAKR